MHTFANVLDGSAPFLLSEFNEAQNKIFVCKDIQEIKRVRTHLEFFGYKNIIEFYPRDNKPYEMISSSAHCKRLRIDALYKIFRYSQSNESFTIQKNVSRETLASKNRKVLKKTNCEKGIIIITTFYAIAQKFGPLGKIFESVVNLQVGQKIVMHDISSTLSTLGFTRNSSALEVGEYAIRGSILDIVCDTNFGYRIDFFGNQIESIRKYSLTSQRSIEKMKFVEVLPVNEFMVEGKQRLHFLKKLKTEPRYHKDQMFEAINSGINHPNLENYIPYFYSEELKTILDYTPKNTTIFINDMYLKEHQKKFDKIYAQYLRRKQHSESQTTIAPLHPNHLFLDSKNIKQSLEEKSKRVEDSLQSDVRIIEYSEFQQENAIKIASKSYSFYQKASIMKKNHLECLRAELAQTSKSTKKELFILCCNDNTNLEYACRTLDRAKIAYFKPNSLDEIRKIMSNGNNDVSRETLLIVANYPLKDSGFKAKEFHFISEYDLFGKNLCSKKKNKINRKNALDYLSEIKCGELIVHKEHGIGRFDEIKEIEINGRTNDFIALTYANNDRLYLPVENLELMSKYSEGEADSKDLDKLGSLNWQKRKAKLKERIKLQAKELVKNAALRASKPGIIFGVNSKAYEVFVEGFKFSETEDQDRAISEVLDDLKSGNSMDRLICGDVGFGKTEVSLRAVCAVVCANNNQQHKAQVMIVVPTTLLARQHYQNFSKRFAKLNVKIAQLSRFTKRSDIQSIKQKIKDGDIDIIIGTHALLADDVKPKNLGLIIIDEEQHFGVKQKEKLKSIKTDVHILTLSATPIPRTLHLSLNGVKSLSIIATPPVERIPVSTFVLPFDSITLKDAIMREKTRGGRTFVVTPRVKYIPELENKIQNLLEGTDIKITSAHGKLSPSQLDSVMNEFYDGRYDVLISTSIIESGLDIPTANTIIIDRSNMFGLGQSYQLRGRVGRSNIKSYAYFTYPEHTILTDSASKRLSIIQSIEDLGGGFHIASHDMEIRGYGNLLGEEQSGHIKEVGMELYQDMLSSAISELKSSEIKNEDTIKESNNTLEQLNTDWSPSLNLGISIQIPSDYIDDSNLKLSFYRRIAKLCSQSERDELYAEMSDRFGPLPQSAKHLFDVVELKQKCKELNIEKLDSFASKISIKFRNNKPRYYEKVIEFINNNPLNTTLSGEMNILIRVKIPKIFSERASFILDVLKELGLENDK